MYDTARDLLDALQSTPATLTGLLHDCSPEMARAARGGDENWSVTEVLCHLRDAEERSVQRTRQMLMENQPLIAGYDQDVWASERDYAHATMDEALASFLAHRAEHIAVLTPLSPADWQRGGHHEEQGDITIQAHVLHMAAHDAIHCAQIARQLQNIPD